jgi:hypothetical protein
MPLLLLVPLLLPPMPLLLLVPLLLPPMPLLLLVPLLLPPMPLLLVLLPTPMPLLLAVPLLLPTPLLLAVPLLLPPLLLEELLLPPLLLLVLLPVEPLLELEDASPASNRSSPAGLLVPPHPAATAAPRERTTNTRTLFIEDSFYKSKNGLLRRPADARRRPSRSKSHPTVCQLRATERRCQ